MTIFERIFTGIGIIVGVFAIGFVKVLIEDIYNSTPKRRAEHQKQIAEWLSGFRKEFPTLLLILSILFLYSAIGLAEDNPSNQHPVGGGRVLTQAEVSYNEAHKIYAVNDERRRPPTPDEIAEDSFAQANMGRDAQGNAVLNAPKTGKRQIISSRLAITPDGQFEGIPTVTELDEHRAVLEKVKERNRQHAKEAGLACRDLPKDEQEKIEKEIIETGDKTINAEQARIDQWDKDKKGETPKYEVPKVFVSKERE